MSKKSEAPKLIRVRVNDHAACAADLDALPKQWVSGYHFEIHPEHREKIEEHLKSGALALTEDD